MYSALPEQEVERDSGSNFRSGVATDSLQTEFCVVRATVQKNPKKQKTNKKNPELVANASKLRSSNKHFGFFPLGEIRGLDSPGLAFLDTLVG